VAARWADPLLSRIYDDVFPLRLRGTPWCFEDLPAPERRNWPPAAPSPSDGELLERSGAMNRGSPAAAQRPAQASGAAPTHDESRTACGDGLAVELGARVLVACRRREKRAGAATRTAAAPFLQEQPAAPRASLQRPNWGAAQRSPGPKLQRSLQLQERLNQTQTAPGGRPDTPAGTGAADPLNSELAALERGRPGPRRRQTATAGRDCKQRPWKHRPGLLSRNTACSDTYLLAGPAESALPGMCVLCSGPTTGSRAGQRRSRRTAAGPWRRLAAKSARRSDGASNTTRNRTRTRPRTWRPQQQRVCRTAKRRRAPRCGEAQALRAQRP